MKPTNTVKKIDQGWSRLTRVLPVFVTLILLTLGIWAMLHLLRTVDMPTLFAQIRATSGMTITLAILGTIVGYMILAAYDWSATRFIGKRLPVPTLALGGFLAYAFGNTVGLNAFSGAAVRYRIYSAEGLDGYDIAAVSSFVAIAYGLGAFVLGIMSLILIPDAIEAFSHISPTSIRTIAIVVLVIIIAAFYFIGRRPQGVTIRKWTIKFPSHGVIGTQMLITFADIIAATFVLWILMPAGSLNFPTLLVIFTIATMAGVISHVPGGIGVFESVVIAAMPSTVAIHDVAVALILFRTIYFLLPFLLAAFLLLTITLAAPLRARITLPRGTWTVFNAARSTLPNLIAGTTAISGGFMILVALLPNPDDLIFDVQMLLPLAFVKGGAFTASLVGTFSLIVAMGLFYRVRLAHIALLGLLVIGIFTAIGTGIDWDRVVYLSLVAVALLVLWPEFYRRSRLGQLLWGHPILSSILATACLASIIASYQLFTVDQYTSLWWDIFKLDMDLTPRGPALAITIAFLHVLLFFGFAPRHAVGELADAASRGRAHKLIAEYGEASDIITLSGDKNFMFSDHDDAYIAYRQQGKSWVALGAPIGSSTGRRELLWSFIEAARRAGGRPLFYEVDQDFALDLADIGFQLFKMGEEAIIPLDSFTLEGADRKKLRTTYNRALRDGLTLKLWDAPHPQTRLAQLRQISDDWLSNQKGPEKRFSVGRFSDEYLQYTPIAVIEFNGEITAFATVPINGRSASIDLMRYVQHTPTGTMEFLFTSLAQELASRGLHELSLGMAPLAGLENRAGTNLWNRFGALVFEHGNRFYRFEGLRNFKSKFNPTWRTRYFSSKSVTLPVRQLRDVMRLVSGTEPKPKRLFRFGKAKSKSK